MKLGSIVLAFTFISYWFPDPALDQYASLQSARTAIRWSLAAIIIAAPLFFWISRLVLAELRRHTEKQASGIRRWMTYLTLLVASTVLAGDLITFVFQLLGKKTGLVRLLVVCWSLAPPAYSTVLFSDLLLSRRETCQRSYSSTPAWITVVPAHRAQQWGLRSLLGRQPPHNPVPCERETRRDSWPKPALLATPAAPVGYDLGASRDRARHHALHQVLAKQWPANANAAEVSRRRFR